MDNFRDFHEFLYYVKNSNISNSVIYIYIFIATNNSKKQYIFDIFFQVYRKCYYKCSVIITDLLR